MQVCYSDSRANDSFERVKLDKNTPFLTSSDEGNSPDSLNVLFKQKKTHTQTKNIIQNDNHLSRFPD